MGVNKVKYGNNTLIDISNDTVTAATLLSGYTAHDRSGTAITGTASAAPTLQTIAKTYTPTTSQQTDTITASSGYDGIEEVDVTVNAIQQGQYDIDVVNESFYTESNVRKWRIRANMDVWDGYLPSNSYYGNYLVRNAVASGTTVTPSTSSQTIGGAKYMMEGAVTVSAMPSGTAGTPTATKGTVSNHSVTVTPSVTNTTGYITGGIKTGTAVTVSASELVSGTKSITANGTSDVTNYASVNVNVSEQQTYTATIVGTGNNNSLYVTYNGVKYYNSSSFTFYENGSLGVFAAGSIGSGGIIYFNGVVYESGSPASTNFNLPNSDIEIRLTYLSNNSTVKIIQERLADQEEYIPTIFAPNPEQPSGFCCYYSFSECLDFIDTHTSSTALLSDGYAIAGSLEVTDYSSTYIQYTYHSQGSAVIDIVYHSDGSFTINNPSVVQGGGGSSYQSKTVTPTTSQQVVTADSGYDALSQVTVNAMPTGTATAPTTINGTGATVSTGTNTLTLTKTVSNTPQVSAGYISSGTAGNTSVSLTASVTTKAAATITPGTSNQTIASGTYLTGTQTISGDANLVGSNIISGKSIFGVSGTVAFSTIYTGSSAPSASLGVDGDIYIQG